MQERFLSPCRRWGGGAGTKPSRSYCLFRQQLAPRGPPPTGCHRADLLPSTAARLQRRRSDARGFVAQRLVGGTINLCFVWAFKSRIGTAACWPHINQEGVRKRCCELNRWEVLQVLVFFRLPQGGKQLSFHSFILYLLSLCHATVNICYGLVCSAFSQQRIVSAVPRGPWGVCHEAVFPGEVQKGTNAAAFFHLLIFKSKGCLQCQTESAN